MAILAKVELPFSNYRSLTAWTIQRCTGVTARQIRYWDQVRLISPSMQMTGGRPGVIRLYTAEDARKLLLIHKLLEEGGMTLQMIRTLGLPAILKMEEEFKGDSIHNFGIELRGRLKALKRYWGAIDSDPEVQKRRAEIERRQDA